MDYWMDTTQLIILSTGLGIPVPPIHYIFPTLVIFISLHELSKLSNSGSTLFLLQFAIIPTKCEIFWIKCNTKRTTRRTQYPHRTPTTWRSNPYVGSTRID